MIAMYIANWFGSIQLSKLQIAVKAYNAIDAQKARVSFNRLHDACGCRVRNRYVCPIHGELSKGDIVMGYQHHPDQYVVFNAAEIKQIRPTDDHALVIDKVVSRKEIDPVYFAGKTCYLLPDGRSAYQPFRALQQVMLEEDVGGVAMSRSDNLVMVWAFKRLLAVSMLYYAAAVRPATTFNKKLDASPIPAEQLTLARNLIHAKRSEHFELAAYRNPNMERLNTLLETKIAKDGTDVRAGVALSATSTTPGHSHRHAK
jgi:Ku protein